MKDLYISNETGTVLYFMFDGVVGSGQITIRLHDEWPLDADNVVTLPSGKYAKLNGEALLRPLARNGHLDYMLQANLERGSELVMEVASRNECGSPWLVFRSSQPN